MMLIFQTGDPARMEHRSTSRENKSVPLPTAPAFHSIAPSQQRVFEARGLKKVYHTGELDVVALQGVNLDFH